MQKEFITTSSAQTKKLGEMLAEELKSGSASRRRAVSASRVGAIICLSGDLGSGKTTFTQGLLKGLKVKGPYTSPTFVIMKKYKNNIFHFDVYRITDKDILNLGWEEIIADKKSVIIVEWADRIKRIIPRNALWVKFEWADKNKRKIIFNN